MRKPLLLAAAFLLFHSFIQSQSITPFVINSSGGSFKSPEDNNSRGNSDDNFYIDWSVAEMTLVNTMYYIVPRRIFILTNGVLQPESNGDEGDDEGSQILKDVIVTTGDIKVFPNPAIDFIQVNFNMKESGKVKILLFNSMGQQIYLKEFTNSSHNTFERIPMAGYTPGTYLLYIRMNINGNKPQQWTYKIIKTG